MSDKLHVFEAAGLGKAPYRFLGVETKVGPINMPDGTMIGAPGQPMGCCQYCSTGILYCFWLESADGKKFYVGSDCIFKSGDSGLRRVVDPIVKAHQAKLTEDRENAVIKQFADYLTQHPQYFTDMIGPHPYDFFARQGKTIGDYKRFIWEKSGRSARAKFARQALIGLGLMEARKPRAKKETAASKNDRLWRENQQKGL